MGYLYLFIFSLVITSVTHDHDGSALTGILPSIINKMSHDRHATFKHISNYLMGGPEIGHRESNGAGY